MVRADVTVAIATLDRPGSLSACLDAVLGGSVQPAEIVIVDQSADDRTERAVAQRAGLGAPIKYVRQQTRGLSASRNAAIGVAMQRIIAFTDDDCVPDQGWVGSIERGFEGTSAPDAITGQVLPFGPESSDTFVVSPRERATRAEFNGRRIPWLVGTGGNFAIRRQWFERVGTFDARLGAGSPGRAAEDAELFDRLLKAGARFRFDPDVIVYHRRQTLKRRLETRWGYGHGIGALCALRIRERDLFASWVLCYWLITLGRELAGSVARRDGLAAYQRLLGLGGTLQGVLYGVRARS